MLQVGEASHKLIENLDVITYYAFRIVAKDHTGKRGYCEVLAKTLRDGKFSFTLRIKSSSIRLLLEHANLLLPSLLCSSGKIR